MTRPGLRSLGRSSRMPPSLVSRLCATVAGLAAVGGECVISGEGVTGGEGVIGGAPGFEVLPIGRPTGPRRTNPDDDATVAVRRSSATALAAGLNGICGAVATRASPIILWSDLDSPLLL